MSTRVPIISPSPMYQAESPLSSWQESETSKPFLTPFKTPQYNDQSPQSPTRGRAPTWDPRWTIAQLEGQVPNTSHTFRDSGYASSPQRSKLEEAHPNLQTTMEPHPPSSSSSDSDTLLGEENDDLPGKSQSHKPVHEKRRPSLYVAPQLQSPQLVHPLPAENYLTMRPPTPPASDISFRSYVRRFKNFVSFVKSLPWMEKERCTADYYPGTSSHSARHLKHRPMIVWHSQDYHPGDYRISLADSSGEDDSFYNIPSHYATPHPGNPADLDLLQEFDEPEPGPPLSRSMQTTHPPHPPIDLSREFSTRAPQIQYPGGYVPYARLPPHQR